MYNLLSTLNVVFYRRRYIDFVLVDEAFLGIPKIVST